MRDEEGNNEIGDQERGRAVPPARWRLLKHGEQRQQNKNGARINDLPLEMISIRLMGAHARGRVSYEFSLTRCGKVGAWRVSVCNVKDKRGRRPCFPSGAKLQFLLEYDLE